MFWFFFPWRPLQQLFLHIRRSITPTPPILILLFPHQFALRKAIALSEFGPRSQVS
jgi:hypothetical protein